MIDTILEEDEISEGFEREARAILSIAASPPLEARSDDGVVRTAQWRNKGETVVGCTGIQVKVEAAQIPIGSSPASSCNGIAYYPNDDPRDPNRRIYADPPVPYFVFMTKPNMVSPAPTTRYCFPSSS